ncbi:MAG: hypothetical protein GY928_36630 [Colwellia sp.]|nr:hypothetical protein [Colwellia sp.]
MKKHLPVKQFNEIKKTFQATKQNGFVTAINARIVHEWLGVGRDFSTWIKARIEKYKFKEHVDYCIVEVLSSPNRGTAKSRTQTKKEYHCTPDMVKQLAMIENSDKGQLVRLYFLDCETKVYEKQKQLEVRQALKVEFRPMTDAISDSHEDPKHYHFSNEADMINRIVLGMSASKFKAHHEIGKNDSVRDYMTELQMKAVIDLQRANTVFIQLGDSFEDRKKKLNSMFNLRFKDRLIEEVKLIEA